MEQLFLTILNRAVTAGWLVLLVMVLRVVLKKAPRAAHYGLWAIVAVRLLWPGDLLPRAGVSLVPTTEPISGDVLTAAGTAVSGGLPAVGSPAGAAAAETAARTGQSLGHIAAVVWLVGMAAMALYLAGSYVRLRVRLRTAVRLEDGDRNGTSCAAYGAILVSPTLRRYFGSTPSGAFNHLRIVLRVSPVRRSISESASPSR